MNGSRRDRLRRSYYDSDWYTFWVPAFQGIICGLALAVGPCWLTIHWFAR